MAVYTALTESDLEAFLAHYDVGALSSFAGIREGVENSNFFVTTARAEYVLTIFEKNPREDVSYFINLTAHLAEHGVPCAHPIADCEGKYLQTLHGKPAALVERLPGAMLERPGPEHCAAVGRALGQMHVAGFSFDQHRCNERGPAWFVRASRQLADVLDAEDRRILDQEIEFQRRFRDLQLPRGTVHADLFRDNVLFADERLAGMIDFYYACDDCLLYDVAITVNDWCSEHNGALDPARTEALLQTYHGLRPFSEAEGDAWGTMLRAGALRFWLSRLLDLHFPRPAEVPHVKDPHEYLRILLAHRVAAPVMGPLAPI